MTLNNQCPKLELPFSFLCKQLIPLIKGICLLLLFSSSVMANPVLEGNKQTIQGSNATSITIDKPDGTVADELLVAIISIDGNQTISTPSGWTSLDNGQASSNAATLGVFYKITGGSEAANYTFSWSGGEHSLGAILRYSGIDTSTPIDVLTSITNTGSSNNPTAPSITTTSDNTMILYAYAADADYGNNAGYNPTGTTGIMGNRSANSGSQGCSIGIAEINQNTAGATGTGVFDMRNNNVEEWRGITIAINSSSTPALDTDKDGIPDTADLDDDNDGIPDIDECYGPELVLNNDFENGYAHWTSDFNRGRNNNGPTSGGCDAQGWVAISACATVNGTCPEYFNYNGSNATGSSLITDDLGTGDNLLTTSTCDQTGGSCLATAFPDHTTGTGLSVYIDPSDVIGESYWLQTVSVEAGKTYKFSAWIMVIEEDPVLEFKINGTSLTGGVNLDRLTGGNNGTDEWQQVVATWNSVAVSGNVVIELNNQTAGCNGNDIRIDDISLREEFSSCDSDGDGLDNSVDLDADNDGIPDIIEAGGIDTNGDGMVDYPTSGDPTSMVDVDGDGLADDLDNINNSGLSEVTSGTPLTISDSDNDKFADFIDLDADNDGIPDIVEAGGIDTDGNGIVDTTTDSDGDGFADLVDPSDDGPTSGTGNTGTPNVATNGSGDLLNGVAGSSLDTDGDNHPDHLDLDADNDGIPDIVEAGGTDTNGNGIVDDATDSDGDGFADLVDPIDDGPTSGTGNTGTPNVATNGSGDLLNGVAGSSLDTDGDNHPDHLDLDADNDGIPDIVEAGGVDTNGNGIVDDATDSDGDGFADLVDPSDDGPTSGTGNTGTPNVATNGSGNLLDGVAGASLDKDGDSLPDHLDLDADNDGIPDIVEVGGVDTNGNGIVDNATDSDNDGFADLVDPSDDGPTSGTGNTGTPNVATNGSGNLLNGVAGNSLDTDGDTYPDHLDLDADNDGIPDLIEAGGIDTNGDGTVDTTTDSDGDGFADLVDPSDDGPTSGTGNTGTPNVATNGSGNLLDGVAGNSLDKDGDLLPDHLDLDADNDGIPDIVEAGGIDTSGDGRVDTAFATDADNDGYADTYDSDDNTVAGVDDGGTPIVETDGSGNLLDGQDASSLDTDGDGYPDHLDRDADNDGIADIVEAGGVDVLGAGGVDTGALPWDADGDGLADIYDQVANDGPAGTGTNGTALVKTTADTDADGQVDASGESMIAGSAGNNVNMDGDAVPNHLDLDADNDGIVDLIETGGSDSNNDGMVDNLSSNDTDNNGWIDTMNGVITTSADGGDNNPYPDYTTGSGEPDFDGDGQPNYLDIDADDDGIVDNTEGQSTAGYTAPTTDSDGDGLNDAYEVAGTIGSFGGVGIAPENTDGTDNQDYLDLDSDNDAEPDLIEGHDSDNDGVADGSSNSNTGLANGNDADFDGLDDGFDNLNSNTDPTNSALNPNQHPDTPDSGTADRDWRATNRNMAGLVWSDTDEDGLFDSGESGISGATVKVFNSSDVEVASVTTASDGTYLVTDLPVGTYYVVFTKPAVHGSGSPINIGSDDEVDSDASTSTGQTGNYAITTGSAVIYTYAGFFGAPLPVELSAFGAYVNDCDVQIVWETLSEVNADRFEVEYSEDGSRFSEIGQVEAKGGDFTQNYKFTHKNTRALNYYRLKAIDLDGSFEYSKIISIEVDCHDDEVSKQITIYPNPINASSSTIYLKYHTQSTTAQLVISDYQGRQVESTTIATQNGWNTIEIDIANLPSGVYFVKDLLLPQMEAEKFIKL